MDNYQDTLNSKDFDTNLDKIKHENCDQSSKQSDQSVLTDEPNKLLSSCMCMGDGIYIPNEVDLLIWENDTLQDFEDLFEGYSYPVDDLNFELQNELEMQINNLGYFPCDEENPNYHKFYLLQMWLFILQRAGEDLSSRELFALNYAISTYASFCAPWERRKEIRRNIYGLRDWFERNNLNGDELERKIFEMDMLILYELTEILLKSKVIYYCIMSAEKPELYCEYIPDLSEIECLTEDDLSQNLWMAGDMNSDNIMDYFWDAE